MDWDTSIAFDPVVLFIKGGSKRVIVRTAQEAANALIKDWPSNDGEEYFAAMRACVGVMVGNATPRQLRDAIVKAAGEVGVTVVAVVH
ncbi:DUF982 domain-containing protein [Rhizobium sp. 1399]|uniref:DUF982 domain-containing protein n=1 Tax=Rhizobium sp. 1399 TaxID=2817758 RepID=UPI002855CA1D|nr:DUF982 domain-containing protein [Rhizobium sp. 1399]MDR6666382.1 hypothetical protein [Rhizobium sp. 1399]